jgi:putative long chain acyl-CoA synthase
VNVVIAGLGAFVQNGLEVLRFGGLDTGEQSAPYQVLARDPMYNLRRYFCGDATGPPVVLVPPMMLAADVYDVTPSVSAVTLLHEHGADPWVVDFGEPDRVEGGLRRTLTDHVVAVSEVVDRVRAITGRDVHLGGYSQGGMFCYQAAAYRRSDGVASVVTFGSPVDTRVALPFGIPDELAARAAGFLAEHLFPSWAVPAWVSRTGFRLLDPVKSLRARIDFVRQLHDREALLPRERQRRFLEGEGWVAWAGPAVAELLQQFVVHNRMISGGFVINDRLVTLADLSCPILCFVGEIDEIGQPESVRGIDRAAPHARIYEVALRAGHFGLVVGGTARAVTWPTVAAWARWVSGLGELPDVVQPVGSRTPIPAAAGARLGDGLAAAADIGSGAARALASGVRRAARSVRELAVEAVAQLPRLARLEQIQPHTRVSLGLLFDEQARRSPDGVCFLFDGRPHAHRAVARRIDNVVRGLIALGVRQGGRVGVLMEPRPSGLAAIAALSRLGAVAVLLRPGGDLAREVSLGGVTAVIADPSHAVTALETGVPVWVLGGGGGPRSLPDGVVDMERIDPADVCLPAWYQPNPGVARELAFVLFTGEGPSTTARRITNHRWAMSAFGTASSAALSASDTVYCITPLHHPSGLLTSVGGAIAGGARIALAGAFDPVTFWDEVRRYGVTVVSYTWTMLRGLTEAPRSPGEVHHPIRLFIGSGMPRGLWLRVLERFAPARVLEFYASTEGEAVLANLSGVKPGAKGRPLPGGAELRLAAVDPATGRLAEGPDGFVLPARPGKVGMLLARPCTAGDQALRGVFAPGDAWLPTGDLFRRDTDGDYWLVSAVSQVITTARGPVYAWPVADALASVPAVDLVVTYPVGSLAVTAVTVRPGHRLDIAAVSAALKELDAGERPDVVHVVDELPVTPWYRPLTRTLREAGLPSAGWRLAGDDYRPLTA